MKVFEVGDSVSRFRLAESCVGLAGCLCVAYSVWTPRWLNDKGLWTNGDNSTNTDIDQTRGIIFNTLEAEQVFGVLSFFMAVSSGALCLVFALCWTSQTVRSYSNTRSLLMAGQALYPTVLLLLVLGPTGFFFLLSWSLFTYQHWVEINDDFTCLGSSYWMGALGWALLLIALPVVFLVEQCVVPDILTDLMKASEGWRRGSEVPHAKRSFSESHQHCQEDETHEDVERRLKMYMSVP
ncbi:uncharacterized protein LOC112253366 [Oncorhynchus tshawytscha]|uniref:uncharacterized protein LOC112253366 n=1 Tax=Oncorhynchus tshawytscha TaxID=74940 RepID=UPI000D0A0AD7|nr:uncharacterized protein LOC112253366 [Oncorhynchus tshawytscha]